MKTTLIILCLLWNTIGGMLICQAGEYRRTKLPRRLEITKIVDGPIPHAMRWVKAAMIIPADGPASLFAADGLQLDDVPPGLDSIKIPVNASFREDADVHLYLVYGWSPWGLDELRSATLDSAKIQGRDLEIWTSRPVVLHPPGARGTADMRFVGWDITVGKLQPGDYSVTLYGRRDTLQTGQSFAQSSEVGMTGGYKLWKEFTITVKESD